MTEAQVAAMRRECELRRSSETFIIGVDDRLTRTEVIYFDWDRVVPKIHQT